jgi:hypothetical protein
MNLRPIVLLGAIIAALVLCPMVAPAAEIFTNGGPNGRTAFFSDVDQSGTAPAVIQADDFVLQQGAATISDVHWWGTYGLTRTTPATDDFSLQIFGDNAGEPGTLLETRVIGNNANRIATGGTIGTGVLFTEYAYTANIAPIALSPGTTYWLSLFNNTANDTDDNWAWETSQDSGNAHGRAVGSSTWLIISNELAFSLTSDDLAAVPEPATLALVVAGVGAILLRRRPRGH